MDLEDDPLQAALATAFADSSIPQRPLNATPQPAPPVSREPRVVLSEGAAEPNDESEKNEYDKLAASWRAESAALRQKAERERERWRSIREKEEAEEREQAARLGIHHKEAEWEKVERLRREQVSKQMPSFEAGENGRGSSVANEPALTSGTATSGDGHDLLTSLLFRPDPSGSDNMADHSAHVEIPAPTTTPPSHADSRTWEEVPSLGSSFPSLSFTGRSAAHSPEPHERRPPPPSVTLAIFDSSLSRRARFLALASSLAINLFLPFINGVMLGFGEIFARRVVSAFGWELPGAQVGIRATRKRKQN